MLPTLVRRTPVYEVLTEEGVELIHDESMKILEQVGIEFRDCEALEYWHDAGADVKGERVYIDRALLMKLIEGIPSQFTLHARNSEHSVEIGGPHSIMGPVSGSPFIRGLDNVRRYSTREDNLDCIKLSQSLPALHIAGNFHCEATDIAVPRRHLHYVSDSLRYSDKVLIGPCTSGERALDTINMMKIIMGNEFVDNNAMITGYLNGNSPLVWDHSMLDAAKVYARHHQPVFMSPFALAGANTPASTVGAIAQLNAEALAGCAFMQLVRLGTPVIYGMFLLIVDMRSGAPMTGTPDVCHLLYMAGQMARFYGLPLRSVGMHTSSKLLDAQAGYESNMVMHAALLAGVNLITHCAGWLEAGLTCSLAKYVTDAEMGEMFYAYAKGVDFDDFDDAMAAVREVGPGGHYLGAQHTIEHYKHAFFMPQIMDHKSFEQWTDEGAQDTWQRANDKARVLLESYQKPALDEAVEEALLDYVQRRDQELPDTDY